MRVEAARVFGVSEGKLGLERALPSLPALVAFAPVFGLAAAQGGYFPTAWGWASVPLFWATAVALLLRRQVRLNTYEGVFLLALAALVGWIALAVAWSVAPAESVLEIERGFVYLASASAVLLLSRSRSARHVLGGLLAAISLIAVFSLLTRLAPDRVGVYDRTAVYRLAQPIGYWNGLAIFTSIGALLAIGLAARGRTLTARATGGGLLVFLLPTFYFTFGRAAWIALAVGLMFAVAVDPRRLQFLATVLLVGPLPAVATYIASQQSGLTHKDTRLASAAHDGHRFGLILVLLAVLNAAVSAAIALAERRIDIPPPVRRGFAVAVVVIVAITAGASFSRYGDPATLVQRGYASFKAPLPRVGSHLNRRLLSFSGNGRADLWGLAWDDAARHPVLGAGPGTYERYFLAHQPPDVSRVRDAHGLYIETLAEVGPIGLALLLVILLTPLASLRLARRHPLAPAAAGAYVAYLVHAGVDWDWELPAVTMAGLVCGASILLAGRRWAPPKPLSQPTRLLGAGTAVAAAGFAAVALLGNSALSRSETAREHGEAARAASDARRARSLMPWSPKPWEALGRAQLAAGLLPEARRSFRKAISMDRGDWRLWYDLAGATRGPAQRRALGHAVALFPRSGLLSKVGKARTAAR